VESAREVVITEHLVVDPGEASVERGKRLNALIARLIWRRLKEPAAPGREQ
jgi:hypothetical protein